MSDALLATIAARLRGVTFGLLAITAAIFGTAGRLLFGTNPTGDGFVLLAFAASAALALVALILGLSGGGKVPSAAGISVHVGKRVDGHTWDGQRWVPDAPTP